jgi:hypothetical protein
VVVSLQGGGGGGGGGASSAANAGAAAAVAATARRRNPTHPWPRLQPSTLQALNAPPPHRPGCTRRAQSGARCSVATSPPSSTTPTYSTSWWAGAGRPRGARPGLVLRGVRAGGPHPTLPLSIHAPAGNHVVNFYEKRDFFHTSFPFQMLSMVLIANVAARLPPNLRPPPTLPLNPSPLPPFPPPPAARHRAQGRRGARGRRRRRGPERRGRRRRRRRGGGGRRRGRRADGGHAHGGGGAHDDGAPGLRRRPHGRAHGPFDGVHVRPAAAAAAAAVSARGGAAAAMRGGGPRAPASAPVTAAGGRCWLGGTTRFYYPIR